MKSCLLNLGSEVQVLSGTPVLLTVSDIHDKRRSRGPRSPKAAHARGDPSLVQGGSVWFDSRS
jgi:hypothetical protein